MEFVEKFSNNPMEHPGPLIHIILFSDFSIIWGLRGALLNCLVGY